MTNSPGVSIAGTVSVPRGLKTGPPEAKFLVGTPVTPVLAIFCLIVLSLFLTTF